MSIESLLERLVVATETIAREIIKVPAPVPTEAVQKKPRATKSPTPADGEGNSESAPAPAALPATTALLLGAAQPAAPIAAAATTPNKEPTLDDVRTALVACQTRKGGKDVPQGILSKYSANKTTGGLPKDKYSTVIAECAAA